ncbi:MAG: hypothetical protein WCD70_07455 [Alphaproteobacteria bacterium]
MNAPARVPKTTPDTIRMPRWIRWSIYGATITWTVTGLVWIFAHYVLRAPGEIEHPIEPWMLRIHGAAVMLGLFMYGSLVRPHITKGWYAKKGRNSGMTVLAIVGTQIVSGYLLYYASNDSNQDILSMIHWMIGLFLPIWLVIHVWRRRAKAGVDQRAGERRAVPERRTFLGFGAPKPDPVAKAAAAKERAAKDRREKTERRVAPATDVRKDGPDRRKATDRRTARDRRAPTPPPAHDRRDTTSSDNDRRGPTPPDKDK